MKKPIIGALAMTVLMSTMLAGCKSNQEQTVYGQITAINGESYTLATFNIKERDDNTSSSRQDPGTPPSTVAGDAGIPPAIGEPPTQAPGGELEGEQNNMLDFTGEEKTVSINSNTSINSKSDDTSIQANKLKIGDTIEVIMKGDSIISISIMDEMRGSDAPASTTTANTSVALESFGYENALFI